MNAKRWTLTTVLLICMSVITVAGIYLQISFVGARYSNINGGNSGTIRTTKQHHSDVTKREHSKQQPTANSTKQEYSKQKRDNSNTSTTNKESTIAVPISPAPSKSPNDDHQAKQKEEAEAKTKRAEEELAMVAKAKADAEAKFAAFEAEQKAKADAAAADLAAAKAKTDAKVAEQKLIVEAKATAKAKAAAAAAAERLAEEEAAAKTSSEAEAAAKKKEEEAKAAAKAEAAAAERLAGEEAIALSTILKSGTIDLGDFVEDHNKSKVLSEAKLDHTNDPPLWIRVSPKESRILSYEDTCASHPFKHCCLGQCRQANLKLSKNDVLWRLNRKLSTLLDVLSRFPKNIQHNPDSSCNIYFAGDSLSSDHAMAANCELLHSGYKLKSCNANLGGEAYGNDTKVQCQSNLYPSLSHFILENGNATSCKKVGIFFSGVDTAAHKFRESQTLNDEGGLFVFNHGVHCNNEGCLISYLRSHILPLVAGENATLSKKWTFMYRETEPQHFDTSGGNFNPGHHKSNECIPIEEGKVNNWRNEKVESFLHNNGLKQQIQTIKLHNDLLPLAQLHHGGDCTHYCYNPFRLDVTWNGMFQALSTN